MNHNLFKNNIKRTLYSCNTLFLIVYSLALTTIQYITFNQFNYNYEPCVFFRMIGFDMTGYGTSMYIYSLPLLAALFGSGIFVNDKKINFHPAILGRIGHKEYYNTQLFQSFVLGGSAVIIPYLFHSLIFFMLYPMTNPDILQSYIGFGTKQIWLLQLLFYHPLLLWFLYVVFLFLVGGLLAQIGLVMSYRIKTKYFEILAPFLVVYALFLVANIINKGAINPISYLTLRELTHFTINQVMVNLVIWLGLVSIIFVIWHKQTRGEYSDG